jgi:hypothetical protein
MEPSGKANSTAIPRRSGASGEMSSPSRRYPASGVGGSLSFAGFARGGSIELFPADGLLVFRMTLSRFISSYSGRGADWAIGARPPFRRLLRSGRAAKRCDLWSPTGVGVRNTGRRPSRANNLIEGHVICWPAIPALAPYDDPEATGGTCRRPRTPPAEERRQVWRGRV